jgi:hypothetical protein
MDDAIAGPSPGTIDRRTRTWRTLTEAFGGDALPEHEILDGIAYDYTGESRCKVCGTPDDDDTPNASEVRDLVDAMLLGTATYTSIARATLPLTEDWPEAKRPSYHSIRRHQLRHLPVDRAAVREIVERRAREAGLRIAVGDGPVLTRAAVLETVRERGFAAIARGDVTPTVAETMRAADALDDLDRQTGAALTVEELAHQMQELVRIVRTRVGEVEWNDMVQEMRTALAADPTDDGTEADDDTGA